MTNQKWEMQSQCQEGNFEITLYWNKDLYNKAYKVVERVITRNVTTDTKTFKDMNKANDYFKLLCNEANAYKNSRFSNFYKEVA